MKIIENNFKDYVFPKKVKCGYCDSILEIERKDCDWYFNNATLWYEYEYTCPCCGNKNKFEELL